MIEEQLLLLLLFVAATATCVLANEKGRNAPTWAVLGALVPVVSLVVIALLPPIADRSLQVASRGQQRPPRNLAQRHERASASRLQ